jgi:hypothetical protein
VPRAVFAWRRPRAAGHFPPDRTSATQKLRAHRARRWTPTAPQRAFNLLRIFELRPPIGLFIRMSRRYAIPSRGQCAITGLGPCLRHFSLAHARIPANCASHWKQCLAPDRVAHWRFHRGGTRENIRSIQALTAVPMVFRGGLFVNFLVQNGADQDVRVSRPSSQSGDCPSRMSAASFCVSSLASERISRGFLLVDKLFNNIDRYVANRRRRA